MGRRRGPALATFAACAALVVAGCAPQETQEPELPEAAPSTEQATTSVEPVTATETVTQEAVQQAAPAAAPAAASPGGPFTLEDKSGGSLGDAELVIQDVRVGSHDGYDRVVFEYAGTGLPGFRTQYTDGVYQQGSGFPLEIAGNAYLQVVIYGTPMGLMPANEELLNAGPMPLAAGNIKGITHGGVFEGDTQYAIGLDKQRAYTIYTLENPTRLVVDIQQ